MFKKGRHAPAHLQLDRAQYFVTGAIYRRRPLLRDHDVKQYLLETMRDCLAEKAWQLEHWVILDNHYHLMATSALGGDLPKIFRKLHVLSARYILDRQHSELPIWWNYWDYCPRDERDYYVRLNYLLNNPVKHGYASRLEDYPYSSFGQTLASLGRERLARQFTEHAGYRSLNLPEDRDD